MPESQQLPALPAETPATGGSGRPRNRLNFRSPLFELLCESLLFVLPGATLAVAGTSVEAFRSAGPAAVLLTASAALLSLLWLFIFSARPELPETGPLAEAPLPDAARSGVEDRARQLGLERLELCFLPAGPVDPPAGALRTGRTGTILLSEGLENRLEPRQLRAVLFHELSHIARRDDLARAAVEFLGGTLSLLIPAAIVARHGDVLWMSDTLLFVGVLAITACGKALTLLASRWLSRRQEVRADRDAALWTGESGVLAGVREKLAATPFEEHR